MVGSLSLEKAKEILELKIAVRDSSMKEKWLKVGDVPPLSAPLGEVLSNTLLVKSKSTKLINWLMDSNNMRLGEGHFAGWLHRVDPALFINTADLMPGLKNKDEISLSDIINFKDMKNIKGIGNGNLQAIKKESGVKTWLGFLKIVLEWREVILGNTIEKEIPKKKSIRQKKQIVERNDTDDDDFVSNSPVVVKRKETTEVLKEKNIPHKTYNIVNGISRMLKRKQPNLETERRKIQSGADDDTHLALALQVSLMQYEEERGREGEIRYEQHFDETDERRHVADKVSVLQKHEATKKNKAAETKREKERKGEAQKLKESKKEELKREDAMKLKETEKVKAAQKQKEAEKEELRKEKARKLKELEKVQAAQKDKFRKEKETEKVRLKELDDKKRIMEKRLIETENKNKTASEKSKASDKEKNEDKDSDIQEELEEGEITTHITTKDGCETEVDTSFDMFKPTPEKKRKREVKRKSFSELFGEESSDDDYHKRQPSGTFHNQKQASTSPRNKTFSSSDSDSILSPTSHSSTSTSSIFSPLNSTTKCSTLPAKKSVKITNITVGKCPEKHMTNKANLTDECKKQNYKKKTMKKLMYAAPSISGSSSEEDLIDETNKKAAKELKRLVAKAQIKPEEVKQSIEENKNIITPVNLQLLGYRKVIMGEESRLEVDLSDSKIVYKFLMTDQFSWMFGSHIQMNMIITVNEIKKKQGKMIVMHMMIDKNLQVNTKLGNPVRM